MIQAKIEGPDIRSLEAVVVRFVGDSGDGMQLTGNRFTDASAILGNDLATARKLVNGGTHGLDLEGRRGSFRGRGTDLVVVGLGAELGSIEVGKFADLVILENNLFDVPPDEIQRRMEDMMKQQPD